MNKKGFTLVELLAVIVLLLAITVMAIAGINASVERNKKKQNETKQIVIAKYAEIYYDDHRNRLGYTDCIKVTDLYSWGVITKDEAVDADGNIFTGYIVYKNGVNFTYSNTCNVTKTDPQGQRDIYD